MCSDEDVLCLYLISALRATFLTHRVFYHLIISVADDYRPTVALLITHYSSAVYVFNSRLPRNSAVSEETPAKLAEAGQVRAEVT
jgi:hypothetical protein